MLLGWALEQRLGAPLDELFTDWIAGPLGLSSLAYHPAASDVMPTEDCPWRRRVLRGEVHDDNCFVLGGVAAHAGVFGNVSDTLSFGLAWLHSFLGRERTLLKPETARRFWKASTVPGSVRTLGWDGVSPERSSTGRYFSPSSRGHLGFTGTSLWIDPEKELVVALLTNRVHPSRANEKIRAFRPVFHDTLLTELGLG
jgi:CubicO group peptidase (beta-lactamase class C family)